MSLMMMCILLAGMAAVLLVGSDRNQSTVTFFDKQNSNAFRGIWSLVVILVHIPVGYQNKLQDAVGSFAYIGVTFFFLTSAYGLKIGIKNNPDSIRRFWRKRLTVLLVPMYISNLLAYCVGAALGMEPPLSRLFEFNEWVKLLLVCYLIFWFVNRYIKADNKFKDNLICALVCLVSLTNYTLRALNMGNLGWTTEIYGFIWGIFLANAKNAVFEFSRRKWNRNIVAMGIIGLLLGIGYIVFKEVVFFGGYLLKILLGAALITVMLVVNTRYSFSNRINQWLGSLSYEVFLLHYFVFGMVELIFENMSSGVFILSSILITLFIAVFVHAVSKMVTTRCLRL